MQRIAIMAAIICGFVLTHSAFSQQEGKELPVVKITDWVTGGEAYFSPDGKYLVTVGRTGDMQRNQICIIEIATKKLRFLFKHEGQDVCTFFSPDGKRVEFGSTLAKPDQPDNFSKPAAYPISEIYTANIDGADVKQLTHNNAYDAEGSYSPDGKKILFGTNRDGKQELYTINVDGTEQTRITNDPDWQPGGPFYMPGGKQIVYRAWRTDDPKRNEAQIFIIDVDGKNRRQITTDKCFNWSPFPSPDGQWIVFATNRDHMDKHGRYEIYLIKTDGTGLTRLTYSNCFNSFPVFSPDGKSINFTSAREGSAQIYIMDLTPILEKAK